MPTISKPWRRFRFVHSEATKLGLKPRFEYFERLVTKDVTVLRHSHCWQSADITDDAREVLLQQPFTARLYRAPDTRETIGFSMLFDKFGAEFRARFDTEKLLVSKGSARDDYRCEGRMRFTQRFITCDGRRVLVHQTLYNDTNWLPKRAMWHAAYDERYPYDPVPRKKKHKPPVAPSEPVVEEMLPEDAEALQDLDLDLDL